MCSLTLVPPFAARTLRWLPMRTPDNSVSNLTPERLGNLCGSDPELLDSCVIDQAAAVWLEIHRLRHSHIRQRISGRQRQDEAPVKRVTRSFAARGPHDVVRRGLVVVSIQFPNSPGAMLPGAVAKREILLET